MNLFVGCVVEVSKAYDHATGARTMMDEIACCEAQVLALHPSDGSVDIWVKNLGEFNVTASRLKPLR